MREIRAGRMIHIQKPDEPDQVMCGSHRMYGGWKTFGRPADETDADEHRCRSCKRLAEKNKTKEN